MKGILVRVGIDGKYGRWNAPVDPDTLEFVYVPIPEGSSPVQPARLTHFSEFIPPLESFCVDKGCDLYRDLRFPTQLTNDATHLDPDFRYLTYGDVGNKRGAPLRTLHQGDFLAFYASLRPIRPCAHNLIYAIVGFYVVEDVLSVHDIPQLRWHENAHTRRVHNGSPDIVVRAQSGVSGRLQRCLPIGELRSRSYRITNTLLTDWGGLHVKDGWIHRSGNLPAFVDPDRFCAWFLNQNRQLVQSNY